MAPSQLSAEDVEHFLEHGWIKIPSCFTGGQADAVINNVWTRLGMDPHDKTTWKGERINMPTHNQFSAKVFAPKAWAAICELLGGEENIDEAGSTWTDALIVNLGTDEGERRDIPGNELQGWHVDGDLFVHYLDSPEQALLVIPLFTDIRPGGGGTFICPAGIGHVAKHLYNHPEGVSPAMTPREQNPTFEPEAGNEWYDSFASCQDPWAFVEATGRVGDVYLLHPLMLHSPSNNRLRELRIITNPSITIKKPFRFHRREGEGEYNLVEQKTLRELGVQSLPEWKITAAREKCVPERLRKWAKMKEEEAARMQNKSS